MKNILILFCLFCMEAKAFGQDPFNQGFDGNLDLKPTDVIHWQAVGAEVSDAKVTVGLRLTTEQNFTLYANKVKFVGPAGYQLTKVVAPKTMQITDPIEGKKVEVYAGGDFFLTFDGLEAYTASNFELAVTFLGCTERICLFPYTQRFTIPAFQKPATTGPPDDASQESGPEASQSTAASQESASLDILEQSFAEKLRSGELSLALMVLVLFLGGLATNLTPCVFPMIPITLRILGSQGQTPWISACIYASGIIVTYTALGFGAALSGGLFGSMMASTTFNLVFAALFVLLGLGMLGYGDLSKIQSIGSRFGAGQASWRNTWLMGAGAGLVAAPCTGPILGGLLAYTAKSGDPSSAGLLFFVYSLGFGLPYVFLGSAAGKISKVQVSPLIQVGIKLLFAAAMFALAFYYLRIPAYDTLKSWRGYWSMIALVFSGLGGVACFVYIARAMTSKAWAILPTGLLGLGLFAATQWLTGGDVASNLKITWHPNMETGLALAKEEQKPILVDGWAEWCEACKKMDKTTYQDEQLRLQLQSEWITVKLDFTDLTEEMEALSQKYGMQGLPVTLLLPPSGDLKKGRKLTGYVSATQLKDELKKFQGR